MSRTITNPTRTLLRAALVASAGLLALVDAGPVFAQAVPDAAADESLTQKSRELFAEGNAYSAKGDFVRARAALKAAWGLMHHWGIAANLGEVELELGHHRDAAEMLAFALRNWPDSDWEKEKKAVRAAFQKARAHVGGVQVDVDVEGATLLVDGEVVGKAPLEGEVFVEPGRRVFSAEAPRLGSVEEVVSLQAGESGSVSLRLVKSSENPPPGGRPDRDPVDAGAETDQGGGSAKAIVVGTGAGLTVVAALTAGVFKLRANAAQSDADENRERALDQLGFPCPDGDAAPVCAEQEEALDRRNRSNAIATGAFVGATVLGAATVAAWWLWPENEQPAVQPAMSGDFLGFRMSGQF